MRAKLRLKILRKLEGINCPRWIATRSSKAEDAFYSVVAAADVLACQVFGHVPVPDHCGIPEHDFCAGCQIPMPGKASR